MAPGTTKVLAFRHPGWSATANLATTTAGKDRRPHGRGMLALVEAAGRLEAAATLPAADLAALRDELSRYRDLFERAPVGFLVMDLDGRIEHANLAATAILSSGQMALTGRHLGEMCSADSALPLADHLARLAAGASLDCCELSVEHAGEPALSLRMETLNLGDRHRGPLRSVLFDAAGLTELEEGFGLAAAVVEHTSQAVIVTDARYRTVAVNPAFTVVTGYAASEVLGQVPGVFLHARALGGPRHPLFGQLRAQGYWQGEFPNRRKDGETYLEWAQVNAIPDEHGNAKYYVCMLSDVSGRDASWNALIQLAYRDGLTGLANRTSLLDQLGRALIAARRDKHPLGLIYLDLDGFKEVNDSLGHTGGDHLLQFVAERLRAAVRQTDLVARIGGDEFAVIMPHLTAEAAASRVATNILGQLSATPFQEQGRERRVAASIGITLFPKDGATLETLLNCADSAMYEAKKAGGNRYRFYSPQTSPDFKQHGGLEVELREALLHRRLEVRYQPRIRLRDLRIIGCEAGVRWHRHEHGELDPGTLASLAETTGLVLPLQHWVMRAVTAAAPGWADACRDRLRIAFGVAMLQFDQDHLRHLLRRVAAAQAEGAFTVELEVPQAVAASPNETVLDALGQLRALGAEITLRGFGSDALSLAHLARLPLTRVKVAPPLLTGLDRGADGATALRGLIALAHALGLAVLADGVETPGQLRFLQEHGCDEVQGRLFSAPLSAPAFAALLIQASPAASGPDASQDPRPPPPLAHARAGTRLAMAAHALGHLHRSHRPAP